MVHAQAYWCILDTYSLLLLSKESKRRTFTSKEDIPGLSTDPDDSDENVIAD